MASLKAFLYRSRPYLNGFLAISESITVFVLLIIIANSDTGLFFEKPKRTGPVIQDIGADATIMTVFLLIGLSRAIILVFAIFWSCFVFAFAWLFGLCRRDVRYCLLPLKSRAVHRFCGLDCNCPCYRPRPQLRFLVKFILMAILYLSRAIAIIMIFVKHDEYELKEIGVVVAISFVFLIFVTLLDIFHYCVWWHYEPKIIGLENPIPKGSYSKKHKRFLPYPILGNQRTGELGDRLCVARSCSNRQLEHILIFHMSAYQPQPRWSELKRKDPKTDIYIGFHQTSPDGACAISRSTFLRSTNPPQMLGYGIYFARSIRGTEGKARHGGVIIVAEVRMGKVKEITKSQISSVRNTDSWYPEFDTIYYNQDDPARDEFCVHDESQIIRWVMVPFRNYDSKPSEYGMDTEHDDTKCFCV